MSEDFTCLLDYVRQLIFFFVFQANSEHARPLWESLDSDYILERVLQSAAHW